MNIKKIVGLAVIALVLYCLIADPAGSASAVRTALNWLGDGASSIVMFIQTLFR